MKKILLFLSILSVIPFSLHADVVPDSPKFKAARNKLVQNDIAGTTSACRENGITLRMLRKKRIFFMANLPQPVKE